MTYVSDLKPINVHAQQNAFSKELPKFTGPEKDQKLRDMKGLADQVRDESAALKEVEEKWSRHQLMSPSIPLNGLPEGRDDSENRPRHFWGEVVQPSFEIRDHVVLGKELDILGIERGVNDELPKRYAAYSPCYRRESGTYGRDTYGIYRIHQFYKVEQVIFCKADADESMQLLELPYRVVDVCTGDMGQGQVYKHDIEAWTPSRKSFGETHSCASFYDFQARRLGARYKDSNGKNVHCYTLNNTCIASPPVLIPLLGNHQNQDGTVRIPAALQPYMGGQTVIVPPAKR